MLRILCEQGSADFKLANGVYYIFEIASRDILKKIKETMVIPLKTSRANNLLVFSIFLFLISNNN